MRTLKIAGWKIVLTIFILCILSVLAWFVYTRFCLDIYQLNYGNYDGDRATLTLRGVTFVENEGWTGSDTENIGKTIGIAVYKKREFADYIWPIWVIEYKGDKEHNRIFVRGLMDVGNAYTKVSN
jgi:hypothetical protein